MMHSVIKHILARQGCATPPEDGHKIALVLFGGAMSGVQGAGALAALADMGLQNAFDDIYASSAGVPNAGYFLTGAIRQGETIYYEDLSGRQFINFLTPWRITRVSYLMNVFTDTKKLYVERIVQIPTRLHIWLRDMKTREEKLVPFLGNKEGELYELLRGAVSMPYLSLGCGKYRGSRYKDGMRYRTQLLPAVIQAAQATDMLILYNRPDQQTLSIVDDNILEVVPDQPIKWTQTKPKEVFAAARRMEEQMKKLFAGA